MSWTFAAWLLLGGSTVLLFIGMPVALTFLAVNLVGAWLYMGGEVGLVQLARSSVSSPRSPSDPRAMHSAAQSCSAASGVCITDSFLRAARIFF